MDKNQIVKFIKKHKLKWDNMLSVGGVLAEQPSIFFKNKFTNLNIKNVPLKNTIIGDITDEKTLEGQQFDFVYSEDTLEHIKNPFEAVKNMQRLLQPGGFILLIAPWSWRWHPSPIDFWRFSPDALEYLCSECETIEKKYDDTWRRRDIKPRMKNAVDAAPRDKMGGWLENWSSIYLGKKS